MILAQGTDPTLANGTSRVRDDLGKRRDLKKTLAGAQVCRDDLGKTS